MTELKKTALYDLHRSLGAKAIPFAGYEMPVNYPLGIMKEHLYCRKSAGLFDVSHMGQILIQNNQSHLHKLEKYIILFPFCSPHLTSKKWPYYNDLISLINEKLENKLKVVIAPGPGEIKEAASINALCILDNGKALDISQLAALIKDSSFVVANDTGPAHMTAHLGSKGIALFGAHTTAHKVSIDRENFKAIQVSDLIKLSAQKVFEKLILSLDTRLI